MSVRIRILGTAGPMNRIFKDSSGKSRSFSDVMYEFYSRDARAFIAGQIKHLLDNPPESFHALPKLLQEKAQGLLILELVAKFCESAEDLAALSTAFATELYMDALTPEDVWKRLLEYEPGDIVNFYKHINTRKPEYFANLYGYPPLHLQQSDVSAFLLRSCRQLAACLGQIATEYLALRDLHNSSKHGMRAFFGHMTDERTGKEVIADVYVDRAANVKAAEFPPEVVNNLYDMCIRIESLIGGMLHWHRLRLRIHSTGTHKFVSPVFGQSADARRGIDTTFFPRLFDLKKELVAKGKRIVLKSKEISKLPPGHVIAIDVDAEEILPFHAADLRDVIWRAARSRPGARLVLWRNTIDGKVGPY